MWKVGTGFIPFLLSELPAQAFCGEGGIIRFAHDPLSGVAKIIKNAGFALPFLFFRNKTDKSACFSKIKMPLWGHFL